MLIFRKKKTSCCVSLEVVLDLCFLKVVLKFESHCTESEIHQSLSMIVKAKGFLPCLCITGQVTLPGHGIKRYMHLARSSVYMYLVRSYVYLVRSSVYQTRCSVYLAQSSVYLARSIVYRTRCSVYLARSSVYRTQSIVYQARSSAYLARSIVYQARSSVYLARSSVLSGAIQCFIICDLVFIWHDPVFYLLWSTVLSFAI